MLFWVTPDVTRAKKIASGWILWPVYLGCFEYENVIEFVLLFNTKMVVSTMKLKKATPRTFLTLSQNDQHTSVGFAVVTIEKSQHQHQ
jgi:hypothetical protein